MNAVGRRHNVIDVLSLLQTGRNDAVSLIEFLFVKRGALTSFGEKRLVLCLCGRRAIQEMNVVARSVMALLTAVAHKRRFKKLWTGLILVRIGVRVRLSVVLDLIRDGCGILFDQFGNIFKRHPFAKTFFDFLAVLGS